MAFEGQRYRARMKVNSAKDRLKLPTYELLRMYPEDVAMYAYAAVTADVAALVGVFEALQDRGGPYAVEGLVRDIRQYSWDTKAAVSRRMIDHPPADLSVIDSLAWPGTVREIVENVSDKLDGDFDDELSQLLAAKVPDQHIEDLMRLRVYSFVLDEAGVKDANSVLSDAKYIGHLERTYLFAQAANPPGLFDVWTKEEWNSSPLPPQDDEFDPAEAKLPLELAMAPEDERGDLATRALWFVNWTSPFHLVGANGYDPWKLILEHAGPYVLEGVPQIEPEKTTEKEAGGTDPDPPEVTLT